jgi:hypothetical protein
MPPIAHNFPLIKQYAGFSSKEYNIGLRRGANQAILKKEQALNLELDELDPHSNKIVYAHDTHTGIEFEILSQWYLKQIGRVVEFPNFLSSSDFRWPKFDETVYEIKTSDKSRARDIYPVVLKHSEKEVLFKSHSLFKIQKVDIVSKTIYLDEVDRADIKIILDDSVFISDEEMRKLLGMPKQEDDIQPSLADL